MIYLDKLLKILKTDKVSIYNQDGKNLANSPYYYAVEPYLYSEVINISHNGYDFEITIKYPMEEK